MNGILYLMQVNIYLIAFYAFYRISLNRETFFSLNRFYLMGSSLLAFSIPVLQSEWLKNWLAPEPVQAIAKEFNLQRYEFFYAAPGPVTVLSFGDILSWIYFTVTGILLVRLTYRLLKTYRWFKNPQGGLPACSFFNFIAVQEDLEGREAIMVHEQVHVQQLHSVDILFFELLGVFNWFNPVVYLLKREIRKVHEYIADAVASETLPEKSAYAMLLFHKNFGLPQQELRNSFFNQSILKQRIMMLQKNKSKRRALWKYGITAPLFLGMLIISSAFISEKTAQSKQVLDKAVITDTIPASKPPKQRIILSGFNAEQQRILDSIPKEKRLLPPVIAGKEPMYIYNGKIVSALVHRDDLEENLLYTQVIWPPLSTKLFGEKAKYGVYIAQFKDAAKSATNTPIYLVNGNEITKSEADNIDPKSIESMNVLKGETAISKYGTKAKNGAIEITLKNTMTITPPVIFKKTPLYVLNGKPIEAEQGRAIQTSDIATVNILTEDAGLKKYGEQGKNGVVEITVKKEVVNGQKIDLVQLDKAPEFPGGQVAWAKYLQSEMKYPKEAREKHISGKVMVSFTIETSGELSNITVLRGVSKDLDEEALRVMQKSPKWNPGFKDGKAVPVAFTIPVLFQLPN